MKSQVLLFSTLIAVVFGVAACNKGGDSQGSAAPQPTPAQQWPYNQPGYPGNQQYQNNQSHVSVDIQNFKIVNREFHLLTPAGAAIYGDDSCILNRSGNDKHKFNVRTFLAPPYFDLVMTFDGNGNLSMRMITTIGEYQSTYAIPYQIRDGSPTIVFPNAFELRGTPSPSYVAEELEKWRATEIIRRRELAYEFDIRSYQRSPFVLGRNTRNDYFNTTGQVYNSNFRASYQPGQPIPNALNNGTQGYLGNSPSGELVASFPAGLSITPEVDYTNAQHISGLHFDNIRFQTLATTKAQGMNCQAHFNYEMDLVLQ